MNIESYFTTTNGAYDSKKLVNCMAEYGNSKTSFSGKNENGETVFVHVASDNIIIDTYQSNGWVRRNFYNANGIPEGETFEGKWDK